MEFSFDVNLLFPEPVTRTVGGGCESYPGEQRGKQFAEVVNKMGVASAHAQGLRSPITSYQKFQFSPETLYLLTGKLESGKGVVLGMIKVGKKKLFLNDGCGIHREVEPLCVLDFYVHESHQRSGCGKKLYEAMMECEEVKPYEVAIDRPSSKFLSFLKKHYKLDSFLQQANHFVVFKEFFKASKGVQHSSRKPRLKFMTQHYPVPANSNLPLSYTATSSPANPLQSSAPKDPTPTQGKKVEPLDVSSTAARKTNFNWTPGYMGSGGTWNSVLKNRNTRYNIFGCTSGGNGDSRTGSSAIRTEIEDSRTGSSAIRTGIEDSRTGSNSIRTGIEDSRTGNCAIRTGIEDNSAIRTVIEDGRTSNSAIRMGMEDSSAIRTGMEDSRTGISASRTGISASRTGNQDTRTSNGIERAPFLNMRETGTGRMRPSPFRTGTGYTHPLSGSTYGRFQGPPGSSQGYGIVGGMGYSRHGALGGENTNIFKNKIHLNQDQQLSKYSSSQAQLRDGWKKFIP